MPLSWNEIRSNAIQFSKDFAGETREHAEAKTFWDGFFGVFGLSRRHVASFEEPVKKLSGQYGFIDLFWKGVLLAEHKSAGKDLGKAASQAFDYVQSLIREGRKDEVPRYIIISDFARLVLHDLEASTAVEFPLAELHKNVDKLAFIPGYKQHSLTTEDPINIKAVQIMGDLHDALEAGGYSGHELERLLVRILFCLFAEDTGIFERNAFTLYLENHTRDDGSDLGAAISQLFDVLNKPVELRQANLREELAHLPYVNGELFAEFLGFPAFNRDMRNRLIAATRFDWSQISPAVFGALFQAVMEPAERRQVGAHYTSERDILKVIEPLFLNELKAALANAGFDRNKLRKLHDHIASLKMFDPACGCGNFLVIAYRELRLLELEILKRLSQGQQALDVAALSKVDVDQMYGIEIEEWPARIAEVAMWLMDHQMNLLLSEQYGEYFVRLPLKKSPHIYQGNALRLDWNEILSPEKCSFVFGNPPFVGSSYQTLEQKADLLLVANDILHAKCLDYVAGWFIKATNYIKGSATPCAFVSTNSITQGQQVGILWSWIHNCGANIFFAYRTFPWMSEARGAAAVHCVIIGFGFGQFKEKWIYEFQNGSSVKLPAKNINPYLVDGPSVLLTSSRQPICPEAPTMTRGSQPTDGGHLLLSAAEKESLMRDDPELTRWIRPFLMGDDFINGIVRYCLWLENCPPDVLRSNAEIVRRLEKVRASRLASSKAATRSWANRPHCFTENRQPTNNYLAIPRVSSERRNYIPIAYIDSECIAGDKLQIVGSASMFDFGILVSAMHMAWTRTVCGRLKSDYSYSNTIVYNNFPWPTNPPPKLIAAVELCGKAILDARDKYSGSTLADLYDPLTMPSDLLKAHAKLDRVVDRCYRSQPFPHERSRVEYLFELYERLTAPLVVEAKPKRSKRR
ncbi:MAG TPA: SAM-dependent methyltransferase [Planctomycetaceae bacterium]|nr:SAM-dependent methyltransferase [Planctomycetaceae bacterium]